jgi:DNA-binding transcriptional MerR regulator
MERLLGLKAHVIRYWEKEIPLVQPKKDEHGRRIYAKWDVHVLLRIKHLLYERHFTVEGARNQLFREVSGDYQDLRSHIAALRSELAALYMLVTGKGPRTGTT